MLTVKALGHAKKAAHLPGLFRDIFRNAFEYFPQCTAYGTGGFPDPAIHIYDTLSHDARWHEKADLILANPPFMTPKGGADGGGASAAPPFRGQNPARPRPRVGQWCRIRNTA